MYTNISIGQKEEEKRRRREKKEREKKRGNNRFSRSTYSIDKTIFFCLRLLALNITINLNYVVK